MIKKLLLSVLAIFGFAFLFSHNTYADSDLTFELTSSNYTSVNYICSSDCSSYRYLITSSSVMNDVAGSIGVRFDYASSFKFAYASLGFTSVIDLGPDTFQDAFISANNVNAAEYFRTNPSGVITFTLSSTNPSGGIIPTGTLNISENGTFDVTNYASAVVDVPQTVEGEGSFIVNLFKGGFWNVATAIVGLIIPILALFLVFRLIHGLIYGKGV